MMNKSIKYAASGALLFGAGNAFINALNQTNSNKEFEWDRLFEALAKGALFGAATGFTLGVFRDKEMTKVLEKTSGVAGYLRYKLRTCHDESAKETLEKANHLREQLHKKFGKQLAEYPSIHGSAIKGLSIEGSDIDIQVAFKQNSGSIADVYEMVSEFCTEDYKDNSLKNVRSQKHSLGLSFKVADKNRRIDVVPLRQVNNGTGDTYLFVGNSNFFGSPTYKKTNPKKQLTAFKFTLKQKQIIKLLKVWKIDNSISIKSIYLEYLVHNAFNRKKMPAAIDKCLFEVIKFIGENITTLRFVDPGNSNNIISNSLTRLQKVNIQNYCFEMLDNINKDERNIIDYFNINYLEFDKH